MGSKRKRRRSRDKSTPLKRHQKKGKTLSTQLGAMERVRQVTWDKELLPEFLWIDALARAYNNKRIWWKVFTKFMDTIDEYIEGDILVTGTISDFGKIPVAARSKILEEEYDLIVTEFAEPVGRALSLYPECPALWLVPERWRNENRVDPDIELKKLSNAVHRLYPGKDDYCSLLRMFPFQRIVKKGRMRFPKEIGDLLVKYPDGLSHSEKHIVESTARTSYNVLVQNPEGEEGTFDWPRHFWRQNYNLAVCTYIPEKDLSRDSEKSEGIDYVMEVIHPKCEENIRILRGYLVELILRVKVDLYDTEKDEVIFGLFARCVRLYNSFLENPLMLSQDLSGIILRCLADTMINLSYLLNKGEVSLFQKFIAYGEGKQKLLMLHLQDNYPELYGPCGEEAESLREQLGGFSAELLSINLGQWAGIDTRKMAEDCNLMDIYRLVYDPTSSAVHGTWQNVVASNLERCANPLHRFHYVPRTKEPPLFIHPLIVATRMLNRVIEQCIDKAQFPPLEKGLNTFLDTLRK